MNFKMTTFLREHKEELINNYLEINSIAKAVRKLCNDNDIDYTESFRAAASKIINNEDLPSVENITTTETKQYKSDNPVSILSALKQDGTIMDIEEYCASYNIPFDQVKTYKLVTHTGKGAYYNIASADVRNNFIEETIDYEEKFKNLFDKLLPELGAEHRNVTAAPGNTKFFDRLVYTDVHINMNNNGDGDPMYTEVVYDRNEILKRLDEMVTYTLQNKVGSAIYIDELGDFLDGLNGMTTRASGHTLPQLTNDREAFDLAFEFKVKLIAALIPHYDEIICRSVTNDNHAGDFAYFVNSAVKSFVERMYPTKVEYHVVKSFFGHYKVGKHCFILAHGKDKCSLKFAMKPILDPPAKEKIDQYCKHHGLYDGSFIEFSKGDSHQAIFDDTTSKDFSYYTYPAFSPPSDWVKTGFGLTKSGFRFYNIHLERNQKITHPYYFN